jgi:hypothetical protein
VAKPEAGSMNPMAAVQLQLTGEIHSEIAAPLIAARLVLDPVEAGPAVMRFHWDCLRAMTALGT